MMPQTIPLPSLERRPKGQLPWGGYLGTRFKPDRLGRFFLMGGFPGLGVGGAREGEFEGTSLGE